MRASDRCPEREELWQRSESKRPTEPAGLAANSGSIGLRGLKRPIVGRLRKLLERIEGFVIETAAKRQEDRRKLCAFVVNVQKVRQIFDNALDSLDATSHKFVG